MKLKIKKLHPDAVIPTYATDGSACFDLYAAENTLVDFISKPQATVSTGLAFEIPEGWQMKVFIRSGIARKHRVTLTNNVGIVDSDYRGDVTLLLSALKGGHLIIKKGDRIAQAQLMPVHRVTFEEVTELTETERGAGGFGSTGK